MKIYKSFYYFIMLFSFSCRSQNKDTITIQHTKLIVKALNNKALKISLDNRCNKDSIQEAINLLEKAIKIDDSCYMCYSNQVQMFCNLKMYDKAINVLNNYLNHSSDKFNFEELKGLIFEKMGNMDSALVIYSDAIKNYDLRIQKDSNNIQLRLNRAFLYFFLNNNSERAKYEYQKLSEAYPNNENIKNMKEIFSSFNRKIYISQLFSTCN